MTVLVPSDDQEDAISWFDRARRAIESLAAGSPGGVAIACVDRSETGLFNAGTFDPEDPRPITPDSQFQIASLTKIFTALLLAKSERLGKVSRHDPVAKYLLPPDDPNAERLVPITLLLLATHHSGLPREPSIAPGPAPGDTYPFARFTRQQLIDALRTDGADAPYDLVFSYSNFGFSLLGQALAEAWQSNYADLLGEAVLRPLGLVGTMVASPGAAVPDDLAPGHAHGQRIAGWTFDAAAPAMGLLSSARELARFLGLALGGPGAPMYEDLLETMRPLRNTDYGCMGMGWGIAGDPANPTYFHSGGIVGYQSFLGLTPGRRRGVAILASMAANLETLGCTLLGLPVPSLNPPAVANSAGYVGRYPLSPNFMIAVTDKSGALYFQAPRQPGAWMKPLGPDEFVMAGFPSKVAFLRDASGKVAYLTWDRSGQKYIGMRRELREYPREVVLTRAELWEYVGTYLFKAGFEMSIRLGDAGLVAQIAGQNEASLFASAKDEFFYKVVDARITFVRDSGGAVAGLILRQNGGEIQGGKQTPSGP